ncbi:MAG: hypothetical protein WCJ29_01615 [bacterium]
MIRRFFSLEARLWAANAINIVALLIQLWKIVEDRSAVGVSAPSYLMFAFIQATLAEMAYKNKQRSTLIGMTACCAASIAIASLAWMWQ